MDELDSHPSYPHPSIAEAVCEVHFTYPMDQAWRESRYGEYFKVLQSEFPTMETKLDLGMSLENAEWPVRPKMIPVRQRVAYRHGSRNLICQLWEGGFTVNELPVYPGWEKMKEDVIDLWSRAEKTLQFTSIFRIGLRFINRIPKSSETDSAKEWLLPTRYIPKAIMESGKGFYSRVRSCLTETDRMIVTIADGSGATGLPGDVVFDIDRIVERELPTEPERLRERLDHLHQDVWDCFKEAQTQRLVDFLRGE